MQVERSAGLTGVRVEEDADLNPLKKAPGGGGREPSPEAGAPSKEAVSSLAPLSAAPPPAPVAVKEERPPPPSASLLGDKYLILDPPEGSSLHTCIDVHTHRELVCRVVGRDCWSLVSAHYRLDRHPHINSIEEIVVGDEFVYLVFPRSWGDLHSHVRQRKRLREPEARRLFRQMAETVRACHDEGVVLRDLKLRKFVFLNPDRTELKLESLEDAVVLEDGEDDVLQDKRGCPAYVSPEILRSHARYSGRAADMWSLGVILYTMLVGRYPFNDSEHASLFIKISRGHFVVPECLSSRAKCLIRSLLRREPSERLTAADVLLHPWLTREERCYHAPNQDQIVPFL